jgi:hypothetical protein
MKVIDYNIVFKHPVALTCSVNSEIRVIKCCTTDGKKFYIKILCKILSEL